MEIDGHRIQAVIPPGVRTGSRVRLSGQGEPGHNNGPVGGLYLIVHILPNEIFERDGDDLHIDVPVEIFTAVAIGETRIPTLGCAATCPHPPGIQVMLYWVIDTKRREVQWLIDPLSSLLVNFPFISEVAL